MKFPLPSPARSPSASRNNFFRLHGPALLGWTLLWALFFSPFLLARTYFSSGDLVGQFYAFARFQFESLRLGQLPIWSPGSFGGVPFAADTQAAVFYPPRYLTLLLSWPFDFPYYALELEVMLHVWLAGLFAYGLAYALTNSRAAGLFTAVSFALGGFLASYPLSQIAILEAYTWLPLALLLIRRGVTHSYPRGWLLAAAVPLSLSLLAGHPQSFLHVGYLAAFYYLFLARRARWSWREILQQGTVLALLVAGIGTAAWLPTLRFLPHTVRDTVTYDFVANGLPMLEYIQLLVPGALGAIAPMYGGLLTLFLAIIAWMGRRDRPETLFWGVVLLLSGWLALGDRGTLFRLVYHTLPGFSLFRQQERLLGIFSLSLALLAGQGMALWLQGGGGNGRFLRRGLLLLGGGLALSLVILLAAMPAYGTQWMEPWLRQAGLLLLMIPLLWWARGQGTRRVTGVALLLLLLTVDLTFPAQTAIDRAADPVAQYVSDSDWTTALPPDTVYRFDSDGAYFANVGELLGVEDIRGISPLKPQLAADFEQLPLARRWQLLNVAYALDPDVDDAVPLTLVTEEHAGTPALYRYEHTLPRAWMVYDALAVPDRAAALDALRDPDFAPGETAVLHPPFPAELDTLRPPATAPAVTVKRQSARRLHIEVTTAAPGLLVISEWDYPGWQARLDEARVPLLTANYGLQALLLPAGRHQISMAYAPWDVPVGIAVSLTTLLAGLLLGYRGRRWQPALPPRRETGVPLPPAAWPVWVRFPSRWLLLSLLLLGFGLRIFHLGTQELRGDEAFSYAFSRTPAAEIIPDLLSEGDPHSPLHYLTLHGWMALAGDTEFALRFLSFAAGVLVLPLLYQIGRRLGQGNGNEVGVLALGVAALAPAHVWLAQDVRNQYTLAILFATLALWLLVRRPAAALTWQDWLLYAVAAALAVYSHYFIAVALLAHAGYLFYQPQKWMVLRRWFAGGALAFLLFLPWPAAAWGQLLQSGQLSDPGNPRLALYLNSVGAELTVGPSLPAAAGRWLFLGTLLLVGAGFLRLRRRQAGWAWLLGGWLGVTVLLIYLVQFSRATFNPFYIGVALPAWWLLLAVGMAQIPRWPARRLRMGGTAVVLLLGLGLLVSLGNYYTNPAYSRTQGYRAMAADVAAQAAPGDLFLAHFPDPALDYYLRRVEIPRTMQPAHPGADAAETVADMHSLAEQTQRIWFVPYHHSVWDPEDVVADWLTHNALQESRRLHHRLMLYAFRPVAAVDGVLTFAAAQVDGFARLPGYYLTQNGLPADPQAELRLSPGDTLAVTLLWEALAPIPDNYTVFVHLLAADGTLIAQHDGIPVLGTRPTVTWEVGDRVLDRHALTLPPVLPAGSGRLVVGLYHSETIERRTFSGGSDSLPIAEVIFAP